MMKRIICWAAVLVCAACSPAPKLKQTVLTAVGSPDAKRELVVVRQDPGAVGSYSMAVFLRKKGNRELGDRVFVAKGEPKVEARWSSDTKAVIAHDAKKEDVFVAATSADGVTIEYTAPTNFLDSARSLKP